MVRGGLKNKGFTLIEIMICIAIVAIIMAISISALREFGATNRHQNYRQALDDAEFNLRKLRAEEFANLPPQSSVVKNGVVTLAQEYVVPGSLKVFDPMVSLDTPIAAEVEFKDRKLILPAELEGKTVWVDYQFFLPRGNSAKFVDESGEVLLEGGKIIRVHKVQLAQGEKLSPLTDFELKGNSLSVGEAYFGQLLVVDYESEEHHLKVRGGFLDENLRPTSKPSETKLLEIEEPYPGGWRVSLPLLKEAK